MSWTCRICGATGQGFEHGWRLHYQREHQKKD